MHWCSQEVHELVKVETKSDEGMSDLHNHCCFHHITLQPGQTYASRTIAFAFDFHLFSFTNRKEIAPQVGWSFFYRLINKPELSSLSPENGRFDV